MKTTLFSLFLLATSLLLRPVGQASRPAGAPGERTHISSTGAQAMTHQQKITTFLWFNDNAEEAIRFYTSLFGDSKIVSQSRWGEGGPVPKGTLMSSTFRLAGQEFIALNGGPQFKFTEAISLFVTCETQAEVDKLWDALTAGGTPSQCGWLKDKYGLWWQIIPTALERMIYDKDPSKARRATEAMLKMGKIDIAQLQKAYDGR
jgi:predicted 3-demethylubiquinone-9 3-methyltransferase (glyoxalase superfamily)